MLVDLHAHTKGISPCCRADAENVIKTARQHGLDGLAIANHYVSTYFMPDSYDGWIEKYIAEWELCQKLGEKYSVKIFNAIEVTMDSSPNIHMLIYGASSAFLRNNPMLCEKSLAELFSICQANGCCLIQAHPFRNGATVQDTSLLHGLEINCHPKYKNSYADDVLSIAKKHRLAVTVGCDYHADTPRVKAGTFLPDGINDDKALASLLLNASVFELQIQEPLTDKVSIVTYVR